MQPPIVSIVVALYQVEVLLPAFLSSLSKLLRNDQRVEAVLVDDGSTDKTGWLVQEFEREHANSRVITHASNQGLFCARQTGVSACQGQFVWLVDGDDILLHLDVQFILQSMISHRKLDLFCFQFIETRNTSTPKLEKDFTIKRYKSITQGTVLFPLLYWANIWRFIICRDLLIEYYRATKMRNDMGEDLVLTTWLASKVDAAMLVDSPIYIYRKHRPGSYTGRLHLFDRIAASIDLFYELCVANTNNLDPVTRSLLALFSLPMRDDHRIEAERVERDDLVHKCLEIDGLVCAIDPDQPELAELIEQQSIGLRPTAADARARRIIECLTRSNAAC